MPRPKKENGAEPKKRSRTGCWPCKARKVKCGEEKPNCANCVKSGEVCDYSIRLNWGGRSGGKKEGSGAEAGQFTFIASPAGSDDRLTSTGHNKSPSNTHEHIFSSQHLSTNPHQRSGSRPPSSHPTEGLLTPEPTPGGNGSSALDPRLQLQQQQQAQVQEFKQPNWSAFQNHQGAMNNNQFQFPDVSTPTSAPSNSDFAWSPNQHGNKRVKLSPRSSPHLSQQLPQPVSQNSPQFAIPVYPPPMSGLPNAEPSPGSGSTFTFSGYSIGSVVNTPATPGSSINSGSPYPSQKLLPVSTGAPGQDPPDLRRLSVKSLLSDPSDSTERQPRSSRSESLIHRTYGYDHGFPDLDIPHNDDAAAIQPKSPDLRRASTAVSQVSTSEDEIDPKQIAFEPGGYYAQPVPIKIPRFLEPLPTELLTNPMNLLYFHHFINHTGRILVPHDCSENPFRGVLTQMAVRNPQLLHLLLAFSASHRARLLGHDEPASRIAVWMDDVLPTLRRALSEPQSPGAASDPGDPSSLAPLATAIMLASLEIISPSTFAVPISWQDHLKIARQLIVAKGGLHHLAHNESTGARDKAIFFLSRWFAYLDVLGSLSGSQQAELPLFDSYHEDGGGQWLVNRRDDEIYQIDCFFGFSGRCIALLANVAEMSAECDKQRIDPITNQVKVGWRPNPHVHADAEALRRRIEASAHNVHRGAMHNHDAAISEHDRVSMSDSDVEEMYAVNEAYHWAGLLHLFRRVMNLPSHHHDVQAQVNNIIGCLRRVRRDSSAESCLLFPMFSAGCESLRQDQRAQFADRLKAVEGWGMSQVKRAREIMEQVWDTGKPWETLINGEFFG